MAAEAEGLGKFHRQLEPERRHRMTGAEVVPASEASQATCRVQVIGIP